MRHSWEITPPNFVWTLVIEEYIQDIKSQAISFSRRQESRYRYKSDLDRDIPETMLNPKTGLRRIGIFNDLIMYKSVYVSPNSPFPDLFHTIYEVTAFFDYKNATYANESR